MLAELTSSYFTHLELPHLITAAAVIQSLSLHQSYTWAIQVPEKIHE
jgi:hypothetical protein